MNYLKSILFAAGFAFIWLLSSCSTSQTTKSSLLEGSIDYAVEVINLDHPMAGMAPGSATVKFKNNKLQVEMSAMGIFTTVFISDPDRHTLTQMVSFMDIKNACIENEKDLNEEFKSYELNMEETDETKEIAGYKCKKSLASLKGNPKDVFEIYYTEELGLESLNHIGPYHKINGMLMEYRIKKFGLELRLKATSVKKEIVKDEIFEVPSHYKIVTPAEMQVLFEDLQK